MRLVWRVVPLAALAGLLVVLTGQDTSPPANAPLQTPDQLDTLVAPIALYPDSLLSQILAASTYPLEIVELGQWLQNNPTLKGEQLMEGARNQGWDPSVAALAAFPDVVNNLTRDIRWTRDLGNAFLAQQADVMEAVQRMRAKAQGSGKLKSNSQYNVSTETQGGKSAIEIVPVDPAVIYVPEYDPAWVWGPPLIGFYPPLWYPGVTIGFGFGPGIFIGSFFGGCCGWGWGWGWGPNWFGGGIYVNNYFLHRYGFHDYHGGGFRGQEAWAHDPAHRLGVPYANREVANRYRGEGGGARGPDRGFGGDRAGGARGGSERGPSERFGTQGFERANPGGNHSAFGGIRNGGQARIESDHGFSSMRGFGGGGFHGGGFGGGARGGGRR